MEAVILPIIGLLINSTLLILFFSKSHFENKETNLYSKLLVINALFILVGLITFMIAKMTNNFLFIEICQKIYMCILVVLSYLSIKYCFIVTKPKININVIKKLIITLTIISIILIFILPLKVIFEENILDGEGPSYIVAVLYSLFTFMIILILTAYLIYKKESLIKITPFLTLIVLYLAGFIIRSIYRELIFEGFFFSFMLFIMYHTIENPDVKLVNKLNLSLNQIKKLNKGQMELLTRLGHEIRTPVNAIVGFSQLAESADSLEEAKENAKYLIDSSDNLIKMVDNIIDISRLNNEGIEVNNKEYELEKLVNDIIASFKYDLEDKNVNIKLNIKNVPKILIGDSLKLKRILFNIIDNSIKYTDKGTIKIDIDGKIENYKCNLIIIVEDTGKGISSDLQKKLFTNFTRAEEDINSSVSGIGLGLSLTKGLLDLLNGSIKIESEEGKGTKVIINLKQKVGS